MAKLHFVAKARKDHPAGGVKRGEPYWWWAFMQGGRGGPKHYSRTRPRRSQLTQSDFLAQAYDLEDRLGDCAGVEDLEAERDDIAQAIRDLGEEQQEKYDNMPEGLQQGPTGELLQGRAESCEQWAEEVESVDCPQDKLDDETEEEHDDRLEDIAEELQNCSYSGE